MVGVEQRSVNDLSLCSFLALVKPTYRTDERGPCTLERNLLIHSD